MQKCKICFANLVLSEKSCTFATVNKKSAYQLISELKAQKQWASCLALFDRAWTLDYYYRLYSLILKYEPQRKYGYKQRILSNSLIISQMGGVFYH